MLPHLPTVLTLLALPVAILAGKTTLAQKAYTRQPAIGVHATFSDFAAAEQASRFGRYLKTGLAFSYQNDLSTHCTYAITTAASFLDFTDRTNRALAQGQKKLLLETDAALRWNLVVNTRRFIPFVQAGAGVSAFNNYYGLFLPAGAGLSIKISPDVLLLLHTQYRQAITDRQRNHLLHSIGIAGILNRKKVTPQKPAIPLPLPAAASKDSDGDGITDSLDACPAVPGFARYQGCPVPDKDSDGINDEEDQCPAQPGLPRYKGCPAPDRDGDGISDEDDQCPDQAGTAAAKGCPPLQLLRQRIDSAARNIFFVTGRYTLLPVSYAALDSVAAILQIHSRLQLSIEGHTDNVGQTAGNLLLSRNRAAAVRHYLVNKGIAAARLKATGYGQECPVAANNTAAGRAQNRRVEMKLVE